MLKYAKFHQSLFSPIPARDIYHKPGPGKGWPEECPPLRAANAFGFDLLANFDLEFRLVRGNWKIVNPITIESDFTWIPPAPKKTRNAKRKTRNEPDDSRFAFHVSRFEFPPEGVPLTQEYAWFWRKGQQLPHRITDNVYAVIKNQVKVSTFLFIETTPDEVLFMTDIPNLARPFRATSALIETDWYPASYPWHCVLELNPAHKKIRINRGDPLCRLIPLKRGNYSASPMTPKQFSTFFDRGQAWLKTHGRMHESGAHSGTLDITRTYSRQQKKSRFTSH
jgi:hypothetical protein